jgi:hemerythrin
MGMQIAWRDDLSIGVPAVDDQHKELFKRFNALLLACNEGHGKDEVGQLIGFLSDYVSVHFFDEEALQQESGYPGYAEHRQQHIDFVGRLQALHKQFFSEGASLALVIQTNNMLIEWLINHISKADRKIGDYLRDKALHSTK